jgi:hypothetical protein
MGKVVAAALGLPTGNKKFYAVIIVAKHVNTTVLPGVGDHARRSS